MERTQKRAAYHEAGHYIVGRAMGCDVQSRIDHEPGGWYGNSTITGGDTFAQLCTVIAGPLCEAFTFNHKYSPSMTDQRYAEQLAHSLVAESGGTSAGWMLRAHLKVRELLDIKPNAIRKQSRKLIREYSKRHTQETMAC